MGNEKQVGVSEWVSEKICALLFPLITAARSFPTEGKPFLLSNPSVRSNEFFRTLKIFSKPSHSLDHPCLPPRGEGVTVR